MKSVQILTFTLVAGLLACSYVSSLSLVNTGISDQNQPGQPQGLQNHAEQQQQQITQNANVNQTAKELPKANGRYLGGVNGYEQTGYGYEVPVQTYGYSAPVVSSYAAPISTGYSSGYSSPVSSGYSTPVSTGYVAPVSTYSAPVSTYSAPSYVAPQVYEQPIVQPYVQQYPTPSYSNYSTQTYSTPSYQQQSYQQPIVQTYQQQSYQQPIVQTYQQQSYQQPIVQSYQQPYVSNYTQSYQQPIVQSYTAPVTTSYSTPSYSTPSYSTPSYSNYSTPIVSTYSAPVQTYSTPSYQTYSAPSYQTYQSNYSTPSYQTQSYVPQVSTYAPQVSSYEVPVVSNYTQSYQPVEVVSTYQQQPYVAPVQQSYGSSYVAPVQQSYGYQQQSYVAPVQQSYGYQQQSYVAPVQQSYGSSYVAPVQQSYGYQQQSYVAPVQQSYGSSYVAPTYQQGYAKRSMNSVHETAPYQLLVDHLAAAASENKEIFTNVSSIECPAKPSDYTCPQMLTLNKEELKKKLCEYETVLDGVVSLVPDTEKAQTRCGAFKINKQNVKTEEDMTDLPERMAIVLGKDCQMSSVFNASAKNATAGATTNDQVYMLVKTAIPSGTKFILADGANMDMLSSQAISQEELSSLMKQCPKKN